MISNRFIVVRAVDDYFCVGTERASSNDRRSIRTNVVLVFAAVYTRPRPFIA